MSPPESPNEEEQLAEGTLLSHLVELRTAPQGHADYRRAAQSMLEQIRAKHPVLSRIVRFADMAGPGSGRLASEKRAAQRRRRAAKP